jgi:hypothetical protein
MRAGPSIVSEEKVLLAALGLFSHRRIPKWYSRLRLTAQRASGKDWSVKKTTDWKFTLGSALAELVLLLSSSSLSTMSSLLWLLQEHERRGQDGREAPAAFAAVGIWIRAGVSVSIRAVSRRQQRTLE